MPAQRQLGFLSAVAVVIGSMLGSGVFTTSGFLLAELHTPGRVLAVWLAGGVTAMLGALCYGALARRFPESGGEYVYLSRTLHPAAGYLAGWVSLLVGFSAPLAAIALAFGEYSRLWFPLSSPPLTGSCLLAGCAVIHALHVERGAWVQNIGVLAKLLLAVVFLGLAFGRLHPPPPPQNLGGFSLFSFGSSLVLVAFSYSGWNTAAYIGSEVRAPERNLPRAMVLGTGIVTLLYLALNALFVYAAPVPQLAGKLEVGRLAAEALGGTALANFVTALISLALATAVSTMIMAGPRVFARMADDRCLPRCFQFPTQGPPRRAIWLQTALALVMLWTATFKGLLTYIGFTLSLCAAAAAAGLIRLRLREGPQLQVPGWPWVPFLFVASVVLVTGLTIARQPLESAVGLGTLSLGWLAWCLTRAKR